MRYFLIIAALLLICRVSYGQETVLLSDIKNGTMTESYYVLKAHKKTRSGQYAALFKNQMIAKGNYSDNMRVGDWEFFSSSGKHIQTFNYDKREFTFIDPVTAKGIKCVYPRATTTADSLIQPVPIGGFFYTVSPLTNMRMDITKQVHDGDPPEGEPIEVTQVLTINAQGVVTKHTAYTQVNGRTRYYDVDDTFFNDGSQKFTPAMINHVPVSCEVSVKSSMRFSSSRSGF